MAGVVATQAAEAPAVAEVLTEAVVGAVQEAEVVPITKASSEPKEGMAIPSIAPLDSPPLFPPPMLRLL